MISLVSGAVWVVLSTIVALLPMRYQYGPGLALLIAAPVLIAFIGYEHGWIFAALSLAAFLSMFRNPLRYLWRRMKGERPEVPK